MAARRDASSFRGGLQPRPTDIFIAVMGVTGAGKSSFISKCCNASIPIGHNLQACTSVVTVYPCRVSDVITLYLVDTPGFDDTNRSDTEVLRELATWLTDSYTADIKLSGIIYLHRISDVRMQGSAKKNLYMFRKLCGKNSLKNVILATTMWDRVTQAEGVARELELTSTNDFWGCMVSEGSKVLRHTGTKDSAMELIQVLMRDKTIVTLDLQHQMVDEKKDLEETNAGKEVQAEIIRERERTRKIIAEIQEQHTEALQAQDMKSAQALAEVKQDYTKQIAQLDRSFARVKISTQRLIEEKYEKIMKEQEARHAEALQRVEAEKKRKDSELALVKKNNKDQPRVALEHNGEREILTDSTEPDLPTRIRYMYNISLHGFSWFFRGAYTTEGERYLPFRHVSKDLSDSRHRIMVFGERDSWVRVDGSHHVDWSRNLHTYYPGLYDILQDDDHGQIRQMSLGTSGRYFMKTSKENYWQVSPAMDEHVDMITNQHKIEVCALGRSGSYFVRLSDGRQIWNFKGYYGALERKLQRQELGGGRIMKAVALDTSSMTSWFAISSKTDGTDGRGTWNAHPDAYSPIWRKWRLDNA